MAFTSGFLMLLVVTRGDSGLHRWANWLGEDLGSRPYAWLRPDFVLPLVIKGTDVKTSQILVEPHHIDAEFHEAWMPFFCRSGHLVVTVDQFLEFIDPFLPSLFWTFRGSLRKIFWKWQGQEVDGWWIEWVGLE